jgi:hypothetical protein
MILEFLQGRYKGCNMFIRPFFKDTFFAVSYGAVSPKYSEIIIRKAFSSSIQGYEPKKARSNEQAYRCNV